MVFERLVGDIDTTDPAVRLAHVRENRSILDTLTQEVARFQRGLGSDDRAKLTEYLEALRDVERRIGRLNEVGVDPHLRRLRHLQIDELLAEDAQ